MRAHCRSLYGRGGTGQGVRRWQHGGQPRGQRMCCAPRGEAQVSGGREIVVEQARRRGEAQAFPVCCSLEELREVRVGRRVELVGAPQVRGGLVCVGRGSAAVRLVLRRAGTQKGKPRSQRRVVQRRRVRRCLEPAVVVARMHQPAWRMRRWCWCRRRRRRVERPWQVTAACGG